ncbi:aminodeoxychorismate synthase component I [Bergeyella porcorum]|uniref:Aminodeoxychorismate synthase component I n=1 Tax=Bergeyella porcorum TaxID=1735111 RepID=A0AAU0F4E9_9FLAO
MDELSLLKVPFFFMIDFTMKQVEIYQENEILESGLNVDFQKFKKVESWLDTSGDFHLNAFPESQEHYEKGFRNVQQHLRLGNSYLVNYTRETPIEINADLKEIFHRSKAKYKLLYKDEFVCFSPETFVEIVDNKIFTHPMKGTIDASVPNAMEVLKNDKKEKAEHYTVVDLLRNDLSMVADGVRVDEFQRMDFIKTQQKSLYAMSSEISGDLKPEFQGKIGSIMRTLLPAGSILGAPKPKTMEIILESEGYERGWYTGVCGWFDGKNLDSCVMIRFIEQRDGAFFFKSGGGITHLSCLEDEYQEMKNKIYVPIY